MTITTTRPHKGEVSGATYSYEGGLKKAIDIAEFYGFHLIPPLKVEKEDKELSLKHRCPEHHLAVIRKCAQEEPHKTNGAAFFVHTKKVPYKQKLELRLDIVGDKESSAESLLLQAACSILKGI